MASMFTSTMESLAVSVLTKYLGKYVKGLQKENLSFSISSGNVVLENLELKKEAIDELELPVSIIHGSLGKLQLTLSWKNFASQPAIITLDRLFLVVGPKPASEYKEAAERLELLAKKRRLKLAELFANKQQQQQQQQQQQEGGDGSNAGSNTAGNGGAISMAKGWAAKVLDNVQVFINNIHIRYEDAQTFPGHPFVCGITLEHLHAQSTNAKWEPAFVTSEDKLMHKLVSLRNLALYWDSDTNYSVNRTNNNDDKTQMELISSTLESLIFQSEKPCASVRYIVNPIYGDLKLVVNKDKTPDMAIPRYTLNFLFDQLVLGLEEHQYRDLVFLAQHFSHYTDRVRYHRFRPEETVSENRRSWWTYAINCVKLNLYERKRTLTWDYLSLCLKGGREYMMIYTKKNANQTTNSNKNTLSNDEKNRLEQLEEQLPYETILLYRSLALAFLQKDQAHVVAQKLKRKQEEEEQLAAQGGKKGWFSSLSTLKSWVTSSSDEVGLELTPEVWKDLYAAISEENSSSSSGGGNEETNLPKEYVKMKINFILNKGSLELRNSTEGNPCFASGTYHGFHVFFDSREGSSTFAVDIQSVDVNDFYTPHTRFSHLIEAIPQASSTSSASSFSSSPYFFSVSLDKKPLDSPLADYRLGIQMKPLNIVISRPFLDRVISFFASPLSKQQSKDLEQAAFNRLDELRRLTEAQWKLTLQNRKLFEVDVDIDAPNIILPEDFSQSRCQKLVLVLGRAILQSDMERMKANILGGGVSGDKDHFLYDAFNLKMSSLAALSTRDWPMQQKRNNDNTIIEEFDVNLQLEICKIDSTPELPKVKLSGALPSLTAHVSPEKLRKIWKVLMMIFPSNPNKKTSFLGERASNDKRFAAQNTESFEEVAQNPKLFEIQFSIPEVALSLRQSQSNLVTIFLKGLATNVMKTKYTAKAMIALHGMVIEDMMNKRSPEYRYLASSDPVNFSSTFIANQDFQNAVKNSVGQDLIRIGYFFDSKDNPSYGLVDHSTDLQFNLLHLMCNRETLVALIGFYKETTAPTTTTSASSSTPVEKEKETAVTLLESAGNNKPIPPSSSSPAPTPGETTNFTVFQLTARLKFLGVTFNKKGHQMAFWHLGNSSCGLQLNQRNVELTGKLGNMKLGSLESPVKDNFPHMLEIHADEMVSFGFKTFPEEEKAQLDAIFSLHMNSCRFVFLQQFLQGMKLYFNEMEAMQALFATTASKAAEAARKAASTKKKFGFQLEFANPILMVPRNTGSLESIRADLGHISIFNSFEVREPGETAVELYTITMYQTNLRSGIFGDPSYDRNIVDNIDVKIVFEKPSVKNEFFFPRYFISIPNISVSLTEAQAYLLFAIVEENVCDETYDGRYRVLKAQESLNNLAPVVVLNLVVPPQGDRWTSVEYNLSLGQLSIAFFRRDGFNSDRTPSTLTRILGNDFGMCFQMYTDESMQGDFYVNSVVLRDERAHTDNVFRDFLTPRIVEETGAPLTTSSDTRSMIMEDKQVQFKYVRTPQQDQEILISWDHPYGILVPEAWLESYRFIWPLREDLLKTIQKWLKWRTRHDVVSIAQNLPAPDINARITSFKITLLVSNSELYFLQEPSNDNTRSIVLNTTFTIMWLAKGPEDRSLGFNFQNLEAFKCNIKEKSSTALAILEPLNLTVDWEWSSIISHIHFNVEPMNITFSYQDFKLLSGIINSWIPVLRAPTPPRMSIQPILIQTKSEKTHSRGFQSSVDFVPKTARHKGVASAISASSSHRRSRSGSTSVELEAEWDSLPLSASTSSATSSSTSSSSPSSTVLASKPRIEQDQVDHPDGVLIPPQQGPVVDQRLDCLSGGLRVTFINDSLIADHHVPLAVVYLTSLTIYGSNWSSSLELFTTLALTAEYYNNTLEAWEPVVESWSLSAKLRKVDQLYYELSLNLDKSAINLTKAFVETAIYTIETLSADYYNNTSLTRPTVYPHYIYNGSGSNLWFWMNREDVCQLPPGVEKPLVVKRKKQKVRNQDYSHQTISIQIEGDFKPVHNLPIDKVGSYLLSISPENRSKVAVFEVMNRMGSKVLHIRSRTLIRNNTGISLDVQVSSPNVGQYIIENVEPEASVPIPLFYSFMGCIRLRPSGTNYMWCNVEVQIGLDFDPSACFVICKPTVNGARMHMFCAHMEYRGDVDQVINLHPTIVLENLLGCTMEYRLVEISAGRAVLSGSIESGKEAFIQQIDVTQPLALSVKIPYFGWSKPEPINTREVSESTKLLDDKQRVIELRLTTVEYSIGMRRVSVFSDYWLVNRTGLRLLYKQVSFDSSLAPGQTLIEEEPCLIEGEPRDWYKEEEQEERKKPFTFAFQNTYDLRGELLCIKIANSTWSKGINISTVGTMTPLSITDTFLRNLDDVERTNIRSFQLVAYTTAAPDKFWRTKVVTVYPRFMLVNNLEDHTILYRQTGTMGANYSLSPGEYTPFHWPDKDEPKLIRIRFDSLDWEWSGAFPIEEVGNFTVKMRHSTEKRSYFARISIKSDKATLVVVILPENREFPDYRIDNQSSEILTIQQENSQNIDVLEPGVRMPFTWDESVILPRRLLISLENGEPVRRINLSKVKQYPPVRIVSPNNNALRLFDTVLTAEGPTKVLCISDVNENFQSASEALEEVKVKGLPIKVLLAIEGIGLSVIDETPQELMYLWVEKIDLTYTNLSLDQTVEFNIGKLQLDNQLYLTPFPVVLRGSNLDDQHGGNNTIFFHLELKKSNRSDSIDYFRNCKMFIQEIDLMIEEEFVLRIINFVNVILRFLNKRKQTQEEQQESIFPRANVDLTAKMIFFEELGLQQIKVNFSFANIPGIDKLTDSVISRWIRKGGALANIDSAPLLLHGLLMVNPFTTKQDLIHRILKHYVTSGIRELHKVLGSADIIGSPLSLMNYLGSGIYDFIYLPYVGASQSLSHFAWGMVSGTESLFKNSFFGIFNTTTKITGTLGKGIATLSRDREYLKERELQAREKPRHAAEGFAHGVRDLSVGVFKGLFGIVYDPIKGGMDDGYIGFFSGVLRGSLGVVVKPIVGSLDFFTRTSEGVRNTFLGTDQNRPDKRSRLPRYFGPDKLLQPFCSEKAVGQEYLYVIEEGKYRKEWYLFHINVEKRVVLVSNSHVLYIREEEKQEEWNVPVRDIKSLVMSNVERGVIIYLQDHQASSMFDEPTNRRLIYVKQHQLEVVYNKLLRALKSLKHPSIEQH